MRTLRLWLRALLDSSAVEDEIEDEIQLHLDLAGPRLSEAGLFREGSPRPRPEALWRRGPGEAAVPPSSHGRENPRRIPAHEHRNSRDPARSSVAGEDERLDRGHALHPRPRYRRQHRDLQRGRRRAPEAPSLSGSRPIGDALGERPTPRHDAGGVLAAGLPRRQRRKRSLRLHGGLHFRRHDLDVGRRAAEAPLRGAGVGIVHRGARRFSLSRPELPRGRGRRGKPARS